MLDFYSDDIIIWRMKRLKLTVEEKDALEIRHQHCTNAKESDGIKAVLLRSEG